MTIYFVGGEDHDFLKIGNVSSSTLSSVRRTTHTRIALDLGTVSTNRYVGGFGTTLTSFWFTGRWYASNGTGTSANDFISFYDGTTRRLSIQSDGASRIRISTINSAGTVTVLATSFLTVTSSLIQKLDVQVISYGSSGTVNVYNEGVLYVTYTGNIITDSATSLSNFGIGSIMTGNSTYWSEMIVSSEDTRKLSLATLYPTANGNTYNWTDTYASIDESTIDDADLISSSSANQVAQTTVNSSLIPAGTLNVLAVGVSGRSTKGGTGPQNINIGIRTNSNDYYSSNLPLPTIFDRISYIWEINPNTSTTWTYSELTNAGFNIGVRSVA